MSLDKSCYLCKHLAFFEVTEGKGYYCTITGSEYTCDMIHTNCSQYLEESEE